MPRKSLSIAEQAATAADLGLRVVPLVPMGKRPWVENWVENASSDIEKVLEWFAERPQSNYGICTGYDGLFVIDLDGAEAIAWWRDQGFPPGAEVRTPNGGMHVYYRSFDVEVQTNAGKLHSKVDVRGVGGQAAGPGSMLATGYYKGDLEAIANAPEAPPELMAIIPEKQTYTQIEYVGETVTEASEKERSSIAWIVARLEELPEVWEPGAGWHDAVFQSAAWLSRMVNSGAYAMTEDAAITILLTHTPTYGSQWGDDKIVEQWLSARTLTAGQFAEPPSDDEDIPRLLPLIKAQEGAPEYDSKGRQFMDLVWTDASSETEGARWDRRRQIFLEAFRAGLPMQQAFSLAAGSVAAETLMREHDGRLFLYKEAKKAHRDFLQEQATGLATYEADTIDVALEPDEPERIELLTGPDRERLATDPKMEWWGDRYLIWVRESVKLANMPYHRMHIWMILSVVFGLTAYIPREGKKLGVNMWGIIIGESSTGKTEALDKAESVLDAFFKEDSPNLGADATVEALHDALIGRDGKPSLQIIDEAHGLLGELSGSKGFRGDLITRWTEFYEGKVRATLRSTKKDISGKSATTSFSLILQGTSSRMAKAMNTPLWESGFLVRSIFVIGENIEPSEDDLDIRLIEGDAEYAYTSVPLAYATGFLDAKSKLRKYRLGDSEAPIKMEFMPEALNRLNRAMRVMRAELKTRPNQVALKPYAARFPNTVLKMASLVALSEARRTVEMKDIIIALHAAEEFLAAAVTMAKLTTDTDFAQQVDAIEKFVAEKGGKVEPAKIYRHLPQPVYEVNRLIDQLVAERRAKKEMQTSGEFVITLIRDKERKAA